MTRTAGPAGRARMTMAMIPRGRPASLSRRGTLFPIGQVGAPNRSRTSEAFVFPHTPRLLTGARKEALFAARKALWAKPMRWFGAAFLGLQHVNNRTSFEPYKFVLWLLAFPCFEASHFCFKHLYLLQHRQLVRLGRDCASKGGTDLSLHFDDLFPNQGSIPETKRCFGQLISRLKRAGCTGNS
jgi:hypothetical protein